jgi:hypothetical protein
MCRSYADSLCRDFTATRLLWSRSKYGRRDLADLLIHYKLRHGLEGKVVLFLLFLAGTVRNDRRKTEDGREKGEGRSVKCEVRSAECEGGRQDFILKDVRATAVRTGSQTRVLCRGGESSVQRNEAGSPDRRAKRVYPARRCRLQRRLRRGPVADKRELRVSYCFQAHRVGSLRSLLCELMPQRTFEYYLSL